MRDSNELPIRVERAPADVTLDALQLYALEVLEGYVGDNPFASAVSAMNRRPDGAILAKRGQFRAGLVIYHLESLPDGSRALSASVGIAPTRPAADEGVARALLTRALEDATTLGVKCCVFVRRRGYGRALCESLGFEVTYETQVIREGSADGILVMCAEPQAARGFLARLRARLRRP